MKILRVCFLAVIFAASLARSAHGAATEATLILEAEGARPGDTVLAGVHLHMKPGWHTYWRNPGGSGIATKIAWALPPGITAGETQWPVPKKLPADDLTTYIYENDVVLLVPLHLAANLPTGPIELKASVKWLECEAQCVPGGGDVHATLTVGNELKPSADAVLTAAAQKTLPVNNPALAARASWEAASTNDSRTVVLEWSATAAPNVVDFYPYDSDKFEIQPGSDAIPVASGTGSLKKVIKKYEANWPDKVMGLLLQKSGDATTACEISIPIGASEKTPAISSAEVVSPALPPAPTQSLALMLFYAFVGGVILNAMPCVLPVIALKILGFVNQGGQKPAQVRKLGFIYAGGVLVSFMALAALVIGVKLAGHQAGWGIQFGNPEFIVVMTVLVTLVALNLFGLFEINLSGKVMGAAGDLSAKEGGAGAFFNGVLATILATPCTAPFLGVALGFAFGQPPLIIVLMFLTVGVGLAAPYVILSWNPALLRLLPKPGMWMEKFKIAMGFPMLATAVWLFGLTAVHYGDRQLWLALFLVLVALAAWIFGEFVQRGRKRKGLAWSFVLVVLAGGYFYTLESELRWRSPLADTALANSRKAGADEIDWQPWSPTAVADARAAGHPVLVDFTASWCFVCQVNRKTSIDIKRVQEKIKAINAAALQGDYSKTPTNITAELYRFGRAGVPLVLVYPANPKLPPEVLPDGYLTPGIVLTALDRAAQNTPANTSASLP